MAKDQPHQPTQSFGNDFRTFFLRGLAIVLPTALTIWLLVIAYQFVNGNIAGPINSGVRAAMIQFSDWPEPQDRDFIDTYGNIPLSRKQAWDAELSEQQRDMDAAFIESGKAGQPPSKSLDDSLKNSLRLEWQKTQDDLIFKARLHAFGAKWDAITVGGFKVLNLIGLFLAVALIYITGLIITSFIGRRFHRMGENLIARVPLIRNVYPAVKQVTDFFFGDDADDANFNRVVAVQYPRKGLWSVGLVTGDTMQLIEETAGQPCLTVFVPSSPTPFTGYVITVPKADTIDLPITVEEALKFAVSGGVVIPPTQVIDRSDAQQMALPGTPSGSSATPPPPSPPPSPSPSPSPSE